MIKVRDNRTTDERMLKDIEIDGYFMFNDVLCRRVCIERLANPSDGYPIYEVQVGIVSTLDRLTWVTPIRDEQICVSIEDWG